MASSSIEWTDATWNPVTGCTRASDGCDLCYAVSMTRRLAAMGSEKYTGLVNNGKGHFNGVIKTHASALHLPLVTPRGTVWFVNSMSDLFHRGVPNEFIAAVYGVMAATPQHKYQLLTKRPDRFASFFDWLLEEAGGDESRQAAVCANYAREHGVVHTALDAVGQAWPLPNVWLGTSVEDDRVVNRVDELRAAPAAIRFLSCEPLIGGIDLTGRLADIDWVIVGGESGPKARPMLPEWADAIQGACRDQDVAYFFKQAGTVLARQWGVSGKGGDSELWPEWFTAGAREMPDGVALA